MTDAIEVPDRLTEQQALNWIAFKKLADHDLTGRDAIVSKWGQEFGNHPEGYSVLRALRALRAGVPFEAAVDPQSLLQPDWMKPRRPEAFELVESEVVALVAKRNAPVAELIAELEAELDKQKAKQSLVDRARITLENAIHVGSVRALKVDYMAPPYVGEEVLAKWPPLPSKRARREIHRHNWPEVESKLLAKFDTDGLPDWASERGLRAKYVRCIFKLLGSDNPPADSHVRTFLDSVVDKQRKTLGLGPLRRPSRRN